MTTSSAPAASVLTEHERLLARAGVPSPRTDVELLAAHVLGVPRRHLRRGASPAFTTDQRSRLADLVAARARRIPLQHLTGSAAFRYLELEVRPGVFVPRPETEVLAGLALEALRTCDLDHRTHVVLEPCTGTGALGLSLAAEQPRTEVVATDQDPGAVALAHHNLARVRAGDAGVPGLAAGSRVVVLEGDLLDPVPTHLAGSVDVLVANPPYLPSGDHVRLEPEVADHDPPRALFGGPDGYEVVAELAARAARWLRPAGWLLLEIDDRRGADAVDLATQAGLVDVRLHQDLTGRDRVLAARRAGGRG